MWEEFMAETRKPTTDKKPYTKPQVTEVRLAAQEAVLALCKDGGFSPTLCNSDQTCNQTSRS